MKKNIILLVLVFNMNITVFSQIKDIKMFLDQCPANDPAIKTILADFEIRLNGVKVNQFPCDEPVSAIPVENYTNPLIYLQTLRVIYYMDKHITVKHLPWTDKTLYNWMKDNVNGINIKDGVSGGYCCEEIDGKTFFVTGNPNDFNREFDKKWIGISGNINFFAHEVRHSNPGGYGHTSCCGLSGGCDDNYNENKLGAYGIQYWLNKSWLTGEIYVGAKISHNQPEINEIINWHLTSLNAFRSRFCTNIPNMIRLAEIAHPLGEIAYLTTSPISEISDTSAISGGFITNDNNASITERGICWKTTPNPTLSDDSIINGSGLGNFTCNMTGLQADTRYYVRAFAVNSFGVAYGNEILFQTSATTGIDITEDKKVYIFPNPAKNILLINGLSDKLTVSIYDINGKLIYNKQTTNFQIDISDFQKGIYAIKIETAKGCFIQNFLKQ